MKIKDIEYPCPACGFEGPHSAVEDEDGVRRAECGDCYEEFEVPR